MKYQTPTFLYKIPLSYRFKTTKCKLKKQTCRFMNNEDCIYSHPLFTYKYVIA